MEEMANSYSGPHQIKLHRTSYNLGRSKFGRRVSDLLSCARGEFIVMAAGDDVSKAERTKILFSLWNSAGKPRACVHSKAQPTKQNGELAGSPIGNNNISTFPLPLLLKNDGRGLIGATNSFSRALIDEFAPFPDSILIEDGALAFRAMLFDGILFSDQALVYYRDHGHNMSKRRELEGVNEFKIYLHRLLCQQSLYLSDYTNKDHSLNEQTLRAIHARILEITQMSHLFSKSFLKRVTAIWIYSKPFPLKRRLFLLQELLKSKHFQA